MKIETSLNARDRAIRQLNEVYTHASIVGMDSKALQEKIISIFNSVKSYPQWVRAYVKGYDKCKNDYMYQNHLVFGAYVNGEFYSTHSDRPDYYQKHGISPIEFNTNHNQSGHYWKTTKTIKPYF